jgi:hypothetical protein
MDTFAERKNHTMEFTAELEGAYREFMTNILTESLAEERFGIVGSPRPQSNPKAFEPS